MIFSSYRLDPRNQRLWRGQQALSLRPKSFAVLRYLLEHPGQLVTKENLLDAVWPETAVSDAVLKVCIREIRETLSDNPTAPRFIETAHRRGYRFIAKVTEAEDQLGGWAAEDSGSERLSVADEQQPVLSSEEGSGVSDLPPVGVVGRETELAQLQNWLDKALRGKRQVVFVTGETGIGKTTVIEAFLERVAGSRHILIARGQCLEQYGAGEAYLPVLEALSRLCRTPACERVTALLARYAPTWLVQMSSLISAHDREALQPQILGATPERMLREMGETVEALTIETPLVLVLEDLHWSDDATLDLISSLARRREPARLLLIGTYRQVEVILSQHRLKAVKQELQTHQRCEELPLDFLSEQAVADYLNARFPQHRFPAALAQLIHGRTDGNSLFMVNAVDYLVAQGLIAELEGRWELKIELEKVEVGVPENIRQMIEKQIDRLGPEDQRVLEAASVAGVEFSAVAVAAGLEEDIAHIEERCEALARRGQFLRPTGIGEMPDGTVAARYRFIHSLYQNVFYQRVSATRAQRLHERIGERGEIAYGSRVREIAAELAVHFEHGRDYRRAVKYLRLAAENDVRRYANREAISCLTRALELTERLPEAEQSRIRIMVLEQFGLVRRTMGDMKLAAEDFATLVADTRKQGQLDYEAKGLLYLASALSWIDRERCVAATEQAIELSRHLEDESLQAHTRGYAGYWHLLLQGWRDEDEQACAEAIKAARMADDRALLSLLVGRYAFFQCLRSEYDAAARGAAEGLSLTLEAGDAFDYLLCHFFRAWALLHGGQWGEMSRVLRDGLQMAEKNGHRLWVLLFQLQTAWLHAQAFDYERAREICERVRQEAQTAHFRLGQLMSLIILGMAHLGLEQYERAFQCFSEAIHLVESARVLMDWVWQMPLRYGLSEYWLAQNDLKRARDEAKRVCELAAQPGERTWLALGRRRLAEIALAEQDWERAEAELARALAVLEGSDAPLARWRVDASVAELYQQRGRHGDADRYWAQSAAALNQLADSLEANVELRQQLLAHSSVLTILRRARAAS